MSEGEVRKGLQTLSGARKLQEGTQSKGSRVGKCPGDTNLGSSRRGVRLYMIRANKTRGVSWYTRIPFVVIGDRTVSPGVTHIQFKRRGESI